MSRHICHCTLKHPSRCRKQKHGTTDCNLQLICNLVLQFHVLHFHTPRRIMMVRYFHVQHFQSTRCNLTLYNTRCASGCVVECRICSREVAGSNLSMGYFAPRSIQPSILPGSVNEYQLRLRRQRQVWLIPIADERVGVQVKL